MSKRMLNKDCSLSVSLSFITSALSAALTVRFVFYSFIDWSSAGLINKVILSKVVIRVSDGFFDRLRCQMFVCRSSYGTRMKSWHSSTWYISATVDQTFIITLNNYSIWSCKALITYHHACSDFILRYCVFFCVLLCTMCCWCFVWILLNRLTSVFNHF